MEELKKNVKKPFNVFHWFVLGVYTGIALGIITCLIFSAISLATTERPHGPPDWEIIKWFAVRAAFICSLYGAGIGAIVGIIIGIARSDRK